MIPKYCALQCAFTLSFCSRDMISNVIFSIMICIYWENIISDVVNLILRMFTQPPEI